MIKYIGSKRALVPVLRSVAERLPARTACDLFAGTTRVGQALRESGLVVHSNDLATYSEQLGRAYIEAGEDVDRVRLRRILAELDTLPPAPGYFTETFCEQARYVHPANGGRIDAIRAAIDQLELDPLERGLVLTSLLEAADRVDSTTGLQMAYLKTWAPRALKPLELREPHVVNGPPGSVTRLDANTLAGQVDSDLVYIDPPYNQHSYYANYHVWETLVRWDSPGTYGVARKRLDCRDTKSEYNSKRLAAAALDDLLDRLQSPWLLVSFNDEGFHRPDHVHGRLAEHGYVHALGVDFPRYVGARIGIHNPRGERVGAVSHLRNTETIYLVGPDRSVVESAFDGADRAVA